MNPRRVTIPVISVRAPHRSIRDARRSWWRECRRVGASPGLSFAPLSLGTMSGDMWLDNRLVAALTLLTLSMSVLLLLESLITIVVNVRNHALREMVSTNLIINLAACNAVDALAMIAWMVLKMVVYGGKYSWYRCVCFKAPVRFLHTVTVFNLCCLSLDRYVFICWPLHYYQFVTPRRCNLLVAACWLLAGVLLGLPCLPSLQLCNKREGRFRISQPFMISYIGSYCAAVVVVVLLYLLVAREVSNTLREGGERQGHQRARRRMWKSVFSVVFIQLVLSSPDMVIQLVSLQDTPGAVRAAAISPILLLIAQLLFLPVYAWKNSQYRAAIVQLFSQAFVRKKKLSTSSTVKTIRLESTSNEGAAV